MLKVLQVLYAFSVVVFMYIENQPNRSVATSKNKVTCEIVDGGAVSNPCVLCSKTQVKSLFKFQPSLR